MAAHMTRHDPTDKPYRCLSGCLETYFVNEELLKFHLSTHHGKKETVTEQLRKRTVTMLDAEELPDESATRGARNNEPEESNNISVTAEVGEIE